MRVFLTGGTGFLGSHVAEALLQAGHQVCAAHRRTSDTSFLKKLDVELVEGSLEEPDSFAEAIAGSDAIVHCAGAIKAVSEEDLHRVNAKATERLLQLTTETAPALHRFVYISSIAAHGPSPDLTPRDEEDPAAPVSAYGRSKRRAEEIVLSQKETVPVTIFRPAIVYGPRDREFLTIFRAARNGFSPVLDDEHLLTAVYGPDVALAVTAALEREHKSGSVYSLNDGKTYLQRDFVRDAAAALERKQPRTVVPPMWIYSVAAATCDLLARISRRPMIFGADKLAEMREKGWVFSIKKAEKELGWRPRFDFSEGARKTAQWYLEAGWL